MKRSVKIWLIVAVALIVSGLILFGGAMFMIGWNFDKLSTDSLETVSFTPDREFKNLSLYTTTANIKFLPSADSNVRVECRDRKNVEYNVSVDGDTLRIESTSGGKWYERIVMFQFESPSVTVYLPKTQYGALTVKENTGNIEIPKEFSFEGIDITADTGNVKNYASAGNIRIKTTTGSIKMDSLSANDVELSVETGKVTVSDLRCGNNMSVKVGTGKCELDGVSCARFTSEGDTGKIEMKNLIATDRITVERSTGDVRFESCDAAEIFVETDTGDVTGSLLSDKIFRTDTDTGREDVPKTNTGGICEITTDTGDIKIEIRK